MTLFQAIEGKNNCLQRFLKMTQELRDLLAAGDFSRVTELRDLRDAAIKAIDYYEAQTHECIKSLAVGEATAIFDLNQENIVRQLLQERQRILKEIQILDGEIVGFIEGEIKKTESEIQASHKGKDQISRFKSEWVSSAGKELDRVL